MNIKPKDITKVSPPKEASLIADKDLLHYLYCQKTEIPKNISAFDVYKKMTCKQPKWLSLLFKVRDFLGSTSNIKKIKGFDELGENLNIHDKAHFFTVTEKSNNKLTLCINDVHLDVCLCITIENNDNDKNDLFITSSVINHNIRGHIYMIPVSIIHPFIVKRLLKNFNLSIV